MEIKKSASPCSNFDVNYLIKLDFLLADNGYNAFLAFGLGLLAHLFNLPQRQAVDVFQIIQIPSSLLHINLVCILKSHFELCRSKFFEDLLLGKARFQRSREVRLQGSAQPHVEFAAGVLLTDEDLEQPAWFLLPSNESSRPQGLSWHIQGGDRGR
jgi:hypothetical protein